jgi:hypothetical protein
MRYLEGQRFDQWGDLWTDGGVFVVEYGRGSEEPRRHTEGERI